MTLLTIGSDRMLFQPSVSRRRISAYGSLFDDLLIIVFTKRGFHKAEIASHVTAYPTNSWTKAFYLVDAYKIGAALIRAMPASKRERLIISAQDPFESGMVAFALSWRFGVRLHIQIHTDLFSPYFVRGNLLNRLRVIIAKLLIPRARCIRVVSARIKRSLADRCLISTNRITVLPIHNSEQYGGRAAVGRNRDKTFRILVVARLETEKGVDVALRAFKNYLDIGGRGILDIVGDGSKRGSLEILARDLGVSDRVTFHGWVEDVSGFYQAASCFLLPSWYEGWGVAAYDALCAGIPVVMTDVGLAGEMVINGKNGLVVRPGDIQGMAEALLTIEQNPAYSDQVRAMKPESLAFDQYFTAYQMSFRACL